MPRPDVSVVIVNRNTRKMLGDALAAVARSSGDLTVETIVVDNASTDGSVEMVRHDFPGTVVIENRENEAYAAANNSGIERSRGRYIFLLNSDTEVAEDCLVTLVEFLDEHGDVGVCGPMLQFPDGDIQHSCFSFETPYRIVSDSLALGRLFPGTRLENLNSRMDYRSTTEVDWLIGAALMARREAVDEVGLLDETFRIHCNDMDWCRRFRDAGYRVMYLPTTRVVHYSGATLKAERRRSTSVDREMLRNLFAYYRKHFGTLGPYWLRFWMAVGLLGRLATGRSPQPGGAGSDSQTAVRERLFAVLLGRV